MTTPDAIIGLGARGDYLATAPNASPERLALSHDERTVFALVGRASTIAEVIARTGWPEAKTIATLLGLRAKGAVVPARVQKGRSQVHAALQENVDLDPERKEDILRLEELLETGSHYEFLGVDPRATAEQVRDGYHEASRRYHPDRYFQKNLGSFRARIERIFRRMSEAHQALSDPDRRKAYDAAHPELSAGLPEPETSPREPESPERMAERQARLARHPYLFKNSKVRELQAGAKAAVAEGNHARAVSLLSQAAGIEPNNRELTAQLQQTRKMADSVRFAQEMERGDTLERDGELAGALNQYRLAANVDLRSAPAAAKCAQLILKTAGDLREAKGYAQRAADLQPKSAEYRVLLGRVLLQADMKKLAKKEFEEAARLDPANPDAKAHLKKMRWPF